MISTGGGSGDDERVDALERLEHEEVLIVHHRRVELLDRRA
jgi:hypothetical protein